ncbi:MAG: iron-sulfur cluster carrier protein ApbC [Candidatus Methylopumilus sp.]|nr:iron-sulfur cluster carrier protein ApbC [Candidatus Methylopumilus sp.]
MTYTQDQIKDLLQKVIDPNTYNNLINDKAIKNITIKDSQIEIKVLLGYPAKSQLIEIKDLIVSVLKKALPLVQLSVEINFKITSHAVQKGIPLISGVKNIIAVASGKGGVGKSTTAVNLALALSAEGARVGILDADIYGPSQPQMLGIHTKPESKDGKSMEPVMAHDIQAMSIGFLVDTETPMVWRGPMVTSTLEQLLKETRWDNLDYLVVDLPPGTGDIQLTLSQKVPVTGAIIVTTPQDIALLDARRGLKMFEKVNIPIIGIVENMATHTCSKCGHEEHIFGSGGAEKMCKDYGVPLLGSLPLDIKIREQTDNGNPTVVAEPESSAAKTYKKIARITAIKVAQLAQDYSNKFPNIVIQKT